MIEATETCTRAFPAVPSTVVDDDQGARAGWYLLYGLRVNSDIPLPLPRLSADLGEIPELAFRLVAGRVREIPPAGPPIAERYCYCASHGGTAVARMFLDDRGIWLWCVGVGFFRVITAARSVEVYPEAHVDERDLALALAGQVAIVAIRQLGYPCLHASAIVRDGHAFAFLGRHGQGKSTMAAFFMRRGATLLTDDALPLRSCADGVYGGPGNAFMKMWPRSVESTQLAHEELPPLAPGLDKKLFTLHGRYPFAMRSARLNAFYVLDRYDPEVRGRTDVEIRTLSKAEGLATLLAQRSGQEFYTSVELAALVPLLARLVLQAPVRLLRYPTGFAHQESVLARLLEEADAGGHE